MSDEVAEDVPSEQDSGSVDVGAESAAPDVGAAPEQAAADQKNYYAAFRQLPQFSGMNDEQIAGRLYESMQREQAAARALQQYQQIIPIASEYLSNKDAFLQWRQAQQAPQQQHAAAQPQSAPQQDPWWNPPKLKEGYRSYIVRDAEGREVIAEHAPLEAKAALTDWMNYRADFARKFLDNPEQTIGPMVEQIAAQRASELVNSQVTRMRQEQFVSKIEQENANWLYSDPEKKIASREGVLVQKYIEDAKAMGIGDPEARWNTAVAMLERDLALQVVQQLSEQQQGYQQAPQPAQPNPAAEQAQRNMEFIRAQAARTAPRNSPATTNPRVPQRPLTFAERLKADLQSQGITGLE